MRVVAEITLQELCNIPAPNREQFSMSTDSATREKLWSMIKKHKFVMMTTREQDDDLRSRPMTTVDKDFNGSLWFFAKSDSGTATAIARNPGVSLSYGDSSTMDFVAIAGTATLVRNVDKKKALWNSSVQAWFPEGPESAANVLIEVDAHFAEFWDSSSSKLVQLFSLARARATGTPPRGISEHGSVSL